ncbi:MAG: hypothetical protein LBT47_12305 [Deltaproteobacteria bacterium]|nr:hypothetical protein [Deltaproteobacteria bacterium]
MAEMTAQAGCGTLADYLHHWLQKSCLPLIGPLTKAELTNLLQSAGEYAKPLALRLAASALLSREIAQDAVKLLEEHLDVPLTDWSRAYWLQLEIPCFNSESSSLVPVLVGHTISKLTDSSLIGFLPDSCQAIRLALKLAEEKWGGQGLIWNWSGTGITGESLGLPLYLGLCSAANGRTQPDTLASGRLLSDGRIAEVEGLEKKVALAGCRGFIIPEANLTSELSALPQIIPVANIDDALELWFDCGSGSSPMAVIELRRALKEPEKLFSRLLSLTDADWQYVDRPCHRQQIYQAVLNNPIEANSLNYIFREIRGPKNKNRQKARDFLTLFDFDLIRSIGEKSPVLAWRLAILCGGESNHNGRIDDAGQYFDLAATFESSIEADEEPEELIAGVISKLMFKHNKYNFLGEPLELIGPRLWGLFEDKRRSQSYRLKEGKKPADKALGDFFGACGQHLAFQGKWTQAERRFSQALECFTSDDDRIQTFGYQLFNHLEAGELPQARAKLVAIWKGPDLSYDRASKLSSHIRPWALFALARYQAEAGDAGAEAQCLLEKLAQELSDNNTAFGERVLQDSRHLHPWQLIIYNLGLAIDNELVKRTLWSRCLDLCLDANDRPTIKAMAFLPLSALHHYGLDSTLQNQTLNTIFSYIDEVLYRPHFQILFQAASFTEAMELTFCRRKELFPFNYR